jgi:hypothetical protein
MTDAVVDTRKHLWCEGRWSEEAEQEVSRLRRDGLSAGQIAKKIGKSRSSVLAKLKRLNVAAPSTPSPEPPLPVGRPQGAKTVNYSKPRTAPFNGGYKPAARLSTPPPAPEPAIAPVVAARGVFLMALRYWSDCAFPVGGQGADTVYCGCRTDGLMYCDAHANRMWVPRRPKNN